MTQHPVLIGVIIAAHGLKGEVKVKCFTAEPRSIAAYGPVETGDGRKFDIAGIRGARESEAVLRLSGVDSRDMAEALKGQNLYIPRAALPQTAGGEYYHADLIGLRAEDAEGREVGRVSAVLNYGAGDILELTTSAGDTELIPFADRHVPLVDIAAGRVVVDMPDTDEEADGM